MIPLFDCAWWLSFPRRKKTSAQNRIVPGLAAVVCCCKKAFAPCLLCAWVTKNATVLRGGQRTLRGFVTVRATIPRNIGTTSAGGDEETLAPAPDSTVAAANLRRQTPKLVVVRTRQLDPPVATATAATTAATTEPPRATPTKRTASETGDANEVAPSAKRDYTTPAASD